jgi:bacteriocin-like protein
MNHRKEIDIMAKDLENKVEEISEDELDSVTGGTIYAQKAIQYGTNKPIVNDLVYRQTYSGGQAGKAGTATKKTPGTTDAKFMMC